MTEEFKGQAGELYDAHVVQYGQRQQWLQPQQQNLASEEALRQQQQQQPDLWN